MTRDDRLNRLRIQLNARNDGVFVVMSRHRPVLETDSIPLHDLLRAPSISSWILSRAGTGPVEIGAPVGVDDQSLRMLNHRRDQLRVGRALLLVFDPEDVVRLSRIADDLWKWATVIELDRTDPKEKTTLVRGEIEQGRYAPALRSDDVVGPQGRLIDEPEGPSS